MTQITDKTVLTRQARPLKIRTDIRDHFEAPTCVVQQAFKTLESIIGLKVSCNPEWDMLWTELEPKFPDKATFVPNITGVIAAWCEVLGARLEDDKFTGWTEDLLAKLETVRSVKVHVQVRGHSLYGHRLMFFRYLMMLGLGRPG